MAYSVTEYAVGQKCLTWPPNIIWHEVCAKTKARKRLSAERKRIKALGATKEELAALILLEREVHFEDWRRTP